MASPIIRPLRPGDGTGLARLWLELGSYYAQLDPDVFQVPNADGLAEWLETRLLTPPREDRFEVVAEVSGDVVGAVSASLEAPLATAAWQLMRDLSRHRLTITMLGVRTAYWRQGIGERLLQTAKRGDGAEAPTWSCSTRTCTAPCRCRSTNRACTTPGRASSSANS